MLNPDPTAVIARVHASPIRRVFAVGVQGVLGALLIYLGFGTDGIGFAYRFFLLAAGVFSLFSAQRLWRATSVGLELTQEVLRDTAGRVLAKADDIVKVDRGLFAFKPSNGFMVHLGQSYPRGWAAGMWWCTGKRLGVGGVVPAGETKFMAEALQMMIATREMQDATD